VKDLYYDDALSIGIIMSRVAPSQLIFVFSLIGIFMITALSVCSPFANRRIGHATPTAASKQAIRMERISDRKTRCAAGRCLTGHKLSLPPPSLPLSLLGNRFRWFMANPMNFNLLPTLFALTVCIDSTCQQ